VQDVLKAMSFGNHKGASSEPDLLSSLVRNDVIHGFALPLPLEKMHTIPGNLFAPLNIQEQNTIDSTGRIVPSKRLTHDQSYKWSASGTSVNSKQQNKEGGTTPMCLRWSGKTVSKLGSGSEEKVPNNKNIRNKDRL
jgi:hypothetical protein